MKQHRSQPERDASDQRTTIKRSLLQPIVNFFIPPPQEEIVGAIIGQNHRLNQLIEQSFTVTLRFSMLLFCAALVVASSTLQAEGATTVLRFFMTGVAFIAILAVVRRINFIYRVRGFLITLYLIALVELANYGYSVETFTFFLTLTALGVLLQGVRGGLLIATINVLTLALFGWQIVQGNYRPLFTPPDATIPPTSIEAGLAVLTIFTGGAAVLFTSIAFLLRSINTAWDEESGAKNLLQQERDRLDQRVLERTVQLKENQAALQAYAHQLTAARDQALVSSHYKSLLLRRVSHELRTPLTAILGYGEMLDEGVAGPLLDKQQYFVRQIVTSSAYLAGLIDDLLDQIKIEQGSLEIVEQPFAIAKMLSFTEKLLVTAASAKGLAFSLYCSPDLPDYIVGDEKRLRQIIVNLANNAIKFTAKGSVQIEIEPKGERNWCISVKDTGAGIPPENQDKIFEAFWQGDGSINDLQKGFGLGLPVVKQLVSLMGGRVEMVSAPDCGSVFTVWLPLVPSSPQEERERFLKRHLLDS